MASHSLPSRGLGRLTQEGLVPMGPQKRVMVCCRSVIMEGEDRWDGTYGRAVEVSV